MPAFCLGLAPDAISQNGQQRGRCDHLYMEDSVAPSDKDGVRAKVIQALTNVNRGQKTLLVRINGLDTPYWYRDMVDLLEQAGPWLDQIMIPKVGHGADIYIIDALVSAIKTAQGLEKLIGFEVMIQSAAGISNVKEVAAASPRLHAMSLSAADFAASMGMATTGIEGTQENYYMQHENQRYWSEPWQWAQSAIVAARRMQRILPLDGPFGDFSDDAGFISQAKRAATFGMVGKWTIHPNQISLADQVFTPSEDDVRESRAILDTMQTAKANGERATVYKGRLVDIASIKQAEMIAP